MANIRRELVRYGSTLPNNGVFDGELFALIVEGSDNALYMWNSNDDAWEPIAGDGATITPGAVTTPGEVGAASLSLTAEAGVGADLTVTGSVGGDSFILDTTLAAPPVLKVARIAVTTSEITNLAATPKELVAASAGKVAIPVYVAISKTATTAHDDAAADGNLIIQTSSGTVIGSSIEADGFVDDTTAETAYWVPGALVLPHADAGDALQLSNDGAEFTDGGSADTAFIVEIVYFLTDPVSPVV